jgi:hypothetical protein
MIKTNPHPSTTTPTLSTTKQQITINPSINSNNNNTSNMAPPRYDDDHDAKDHRHRFQLSSSPPRRSPPRKQQVIGNHHLNGNSNHHNNNNNNKMTAATAAVQEPKGHKLSIIPEQVVVTTTTTATRRTAGRGSRNSSDGVWNRPDPPDRRPLSNGNNFSSEVHDKSTQPDAPQQQQQLAPFNTSEAEATAPLTVSTLFVGDDEYDDDEYYGDNCGKDSSCSSMPLLLDRQDPSSQHELLMLHDLQQQLHDEREQRQMLQAQVGQLQHQVLGYQEQVQQLTSQVQALSMVSSSASSTRRASKDAASSAPTFVSDTVNNKTSNTPQYEDEGKARTSEILVNAASFRRDASNEDKRSSDQLAKQEHEEVTEESPREEGDKISTAMVPDTSTSMVSDTPRHAQSSLPRSLEMVVSPLASSSVRMKETQFAILTHLKQLAEMESAESSEDIQDLDELEALILERLDILSEQMYHYDQLEKQQQQQQQGRTDKVEVGTPQRLKNKVDEESFDDSRIAEALKQLCETSSEYQVAAMEEACATARREAWEEAMKIMGKPSSPSTPLLPLVLE